ncbi:DNA polymerase III subunit gamma/tau [Patescibacteria group bacterium]|nr:DNA polymerase III subunit gamma/tau [Patescibacteria group bacterium]
MSITLYRKYRPQKFTEVMGQNHIKLTLENEISSGKISHAYLFSGPHGVGKTTMARILTKSLNCRKRQKTEPCNSCTSCVDINEGRSMDMIEIDAASNRGINEIRELREQVRFVPLKENYKVFIIDEVHMLTTEAFNALLKTLEEPPSHVIFVLATTEIQKVPDTIISRCQHFNFKKVPLNEICRHLESIVSKENVKVDKKVLENIARHSGGYLRDAVSLLGQILTLGEKEISEEEALLVIPRSNVETIFEFLNYLFKGQTAQALQLIERFMEEGGDIEFFTKEVVEYLRKILLAKTTANWQELLWDLNKDSLEELHSYLSEIKIVDLRKMLEYLLEAMSAMKQAEIVQLPLELAIIKISELNHDSDQNFPDQPTKDIKNPVVTKKSQEKGNSQSSVTLAEIQNKWQQVISDLKKHNHSLSTFIKGARPIRMEGLSLVISFKYAFHWERVKDQKNKKCVEEVLKKIFGQDIILCGEIENINFKKSKSESGQKDDKMIETVLETLGGEVVS